MKTPCSIIVFAKAPVPGEVKTRLFPVLGPDEAARFSERLIHHALARARQAAVGPVSLWCAPTADHPFFRHCSEEFGAALHTQRGSDLGERMENALEETLKNEEAALLMGADSPSLTPDDLTEGATLLHRGFNAVISPAEDGGYVMIGLRQSASSLFTGIPWGTETVMEETRRRFRNLGWRWHELPTRWDVDRPEDVDRLRREGYMSIAA